MGLTAHTKQALKLSLGERGGTEMINAVEGFAKTIKALTTPRQPEPPQPGVEPSASVATTSAPAVNLPPPTAANGPTPYVSVPATEEDASHLDGPVA